MQPHTPPLSPTRFQTLLTIAETFIPSLTPSEILEAKAKISKTVINPQWDAIDAFLKQSCTECEEFKRALERMLGKIPGEEREKLGGVLDLLSSGGLISTLFTLTTTPFTALPLSQRSKILLSWSTARLPLFRSLFTSLKQLVLIPYLKTNPTVLSAIEFPRLDPGRDDPERYRPESYHKPSFENFPAGEAEVELEADVVIIGSGSGGGVVAAKLAGAEMKGENGEKRKVRVLVIEKGEWVSQEEMPLGEEDAGRLFDGEVGAVFTEGKEGAFLTGNVWGGGSTINFSGSLELTSEVRKEWAKEHGLSFATTPEFQHCFDRVSKRMGVSTTSLTHNATNNVLLTGASNLHYPALTIPQNTGNNPHSCGYCGYGCRYAEKQGTAVSFLVDAEKGGVRLVKGCLVKKLIFDEEDGRKVMGVRGVLQDGRKVMVKCGRVVISGGALRTPCLLAGSGVENPHLGKNLKAHPSLFTISFFNDQEIKPWEGSIMTTLIPTPPTDPSQPSTSKIMNMQFFPGLTGWMIPWTSPQHWKSQILRYKHTVASVAIARDIDSIGSVTPHPETGNPVVTFEMGKQDQKSLIDGVVATVKIHIAAGATEVNPIIGNNIMVNPYTVSDLDLSLPPAQRTETPEFKTYIANLNRIGSGRKFHSAHPGGTCRMGASPESSVVDVNGRVWGKEGVWVADASLFPSATGVNPMLTTMALAEWVAGGIVKGLEEE